MKTGSCKYEEGLVHSCFDCGCDECQQAMTEYGLWLDEKAKEDDFNKMVETLGGCANGRCNY